MDTATHDPRWQALCNRDARFDGEFVYGVRTTGVYCRPSCPARQPRRENVAFYATPVEAEAAGLRSCLRCRPAGPSRAEVHAQAVAAACRRIDEAGGEAVPLQALAEAAGLSSSHLHRLFKAATGLTPKAYAGARRAERVRQRLSGGGGSVTAAIYDAGFNSNSRFYEAARGVLGMTPGAYRRGGAGAVIRFAIGECTLGSILIASSEQGICAIGLGDDPQALLRELQDRFANAELIGGDIAFEQRVAQVVGFVEAPALGLGLPLDVRGTVLQQRVWQALREIPPGGTVSYAEIARRIGAPKSVRAVAQACGANPIAVAIPCHRVVRSDGGLAGYRWGVERKRALLQREAA